MQNKPHFFFGNRGSQKGGRGGVRHLGKIPKKSRFSFWAASLSFLVCFLSWIPITEHQSPNVSTLTANFQNIIWSSIRLPEQKAFLTSENVWYIWGGPEIKIPFYHFLFFKYDDLRLFLRLKPIMPLQIWSAGLSLFPLAKYWEQISRNLINHRDWQILKHFTLSFSSLSHLKGYLYLYHIFTHTLPNSTWHGWHMAIPIINMCPIKFTNNYSIIFWKLVMPFLSSQKRTSVNESVMVMAHFTNEPMDI